MTERFERVLGRFGRDITVLRSGDKREGKGFLSPLENTSEELPYALSDLGTADDRKYRLITRMEIAEGDELLCGETHFRVRQSTSVYAGKFFSHYEAIVTKSGEAEI